METAGIGVDTLLQWGPVSITNTVITTWGIMAVTGLFTWLASRQLSLKPGLWQTAIEGIVSSIEEAIRAVAPEQTQLLLPFIGSLWVFLVIANLSGLIPGLHSPTRDLSATAALAILVRSEEHTSELQSRGLISYAVFCLKKKRIVRRNPPMILTSETSATPNADKTLLETP